MSAPSPAPVAVTARRGSDEVVRVGDRYEVRLHPDSTARVGDCRDCRHMIGHVTWWCKSAAAAEHYGTKVPAIHDPPCPHWAEADRLPVLVLTLFPRLWLRVTKWAMPRREM